MKTGYAASAPIALVKTEFTIGLLVTQWNSGIIEALSAGARRALSAWGVGSENLRECQVPGAFELPLAAQYLFEEGRCDGVVALGAVIRGETPHFEFVAGECARGLMDVQLKFARPIGFGVLTVNSLAQAEARAGTGNDNKGYESAIAVLEMMHLKRGLQ